MKIPVSWLKEYVDFEDTVEGLCDKLVFSGIEVEGVETVGGAPEGVVAAKVLSVREHPDSDHLHLCVVDYGAAGPLEIVCGAPNVEAGGTRRSGRSCPAGSRSRSARCAGWRAAGCCAASASWGCRRTTAG